MAILNYLAFKYDIKPQTAEEMYEMNWYTETLKDHEKKELTPAIFTAGCDQEIIDGFIANYGEFYDKLEARWADNRTHVAGNTITAADYYLLAGYTSVATNPNLRNPAVGAGIKAKVESCPNVMRVINSIKNELAGAVDSLNYSWI